MNKKIEFVTEENQITLHGNRVVYRTCCGSHMVKDEAGNEVGTMFSYEYVRTNANAPAKRPVLFAYNGGPGASCFWLHMGCLAPKRVKTAWLFREEDMPSGSLLEKNPDCPLDVCDIVLIDPLGTGRGKITNEEKAKEFFDPEKDAGIIADFIIQWICDNQRIDSPVYLVGESYGTIRSTLVTSVLAGGPLFPQRKAKGILVSGIVMMGNSVISEPTNSFFSEKGLPHCVQILPTAAAAHWYHQTKKSVTLEARLKETEDFIENVYLRALYLGNRLPEKEREAVARRLSDLTGLSAKWLLHHRLQFDSAFFRNTRLADYGKLLSLYDARFTRRQGTEIDPAADDAALGKLAPYFLKGLREYEVELNLPEETYVYTDFNQAMGWSFSANYTPFAHLQAALDRNKKMRVFFANGVYDFCSEAGQAVYAAAKLQADEDQVIVKNYPAGHMPYIGIESAKQFGDDLREFLCREA